MKGSIQKTFAFILLLLIPIFIASNFFFFRAKKDLPSSFSSDFMSDDTLFNEKRFAFLLFSNDCLKNPDQNISSILEQTYDNYRIVLMETKNILPYVDSIKQAIAKANKSHLLTIKSFDEEKPTVACFQQILDSFYDFEIVIQLDCNDWLANNEVVAKLNYIYTSNQETWLTYSQYLEYPSYQKGIIDPYMKKMLRNRKTKNFPWASSYLKTYYAGLFKHIKKTAHLKNTPHEPDRLDLYFLPVAQYSRYHTYFIEEVLYIHNTN
ncbi:MAG: hypothetical protein FJZ59_03440 [Chlamydiae bacterium]|jgi:hypothetical protein|nr:hypothetical protein [Chlamydiota bacterium]